MRRPPPRRMRRQHLAFEPDIDNPERSTNTPASAAKISGAARRTVESAMTAACSRRLPQPDGADLVAERGPAQQHPVENSGQHGQQRDRIERRTAGIKAGAGEKVAQRGQLQGRGEGLRFEGALARGDQHFDQKPRHQPDRGEGRGETGGGIRRGRGCG
jgi:hypothetical protein